MYRFICIGIILCLSMPIWAQSSKMPITLSLSKAIELGKENSISIKKSETNLELKRNGALRAFSINNPTLNFEYDYIPSGKGISDFGERKISLEQEFDFPTLYLSRYELNKLGIKSAEIELQSALKEVELTISIAYYDALIAQKIKNLASSSMLEAEDLLNKTSKRFAIGEISTMEFLALKLQFTEAQKAFTEADGALRKSYQTLSKTLSITSESIPEFVFTDSIFVDKEPLNFESLLSTISESNPSFLQSQNRINEAKIKTDIAWQSLLPQLSLGIGKQTVSGNNDFYSAKLGISLPIWFAFNQNRIISEASIESSIAYLDAKATKLRVESKLKEVYEEYITSFKLVQLYESTILSQSNELYSVAYKNYTEGEITYLEFFNAKQLVNSAKREHYAALNKMLTAKIELQKLLLSTEN